MSNTIPPNHAMAHYEFNLQQCQTIPPNEHIMNLWHIIMKIPFIMAHYKFTLQQCQRRLTRAKNQPITANQLN
jgi:hypothetical protein